MGKNSIIKTFDECGYCKNFDIDCDVCRIYGIKIPKDTSICYDGPLKIDLEKAIEITKLIHTLTGEIVSQNNYKSRH